MKSIRFSKYRVAKAKNRLQESAFKLLLSIVNEYRDENISIAKLLSAGERGLIKAVEGFDYQKGYIFSIYSALWIRWEIWSLVSKEKRGRLS